MVHGVPILLIAGLCQSPAPQPPVSVEVFRKLVLQNLPHPLVDKKIEWDKQKMVATGLKVDPRKPLKIEVKKELKNDGLWKKVAADLIDPEKNLQLGIDNITNTPDGKTRFTVNVNAPVRVVYNQQLWQNGIKLFSGETRARAVAGMALLCETQSEVKWKGLFPDVSIKYKVLEAKAGYDKLVVEHTLGVGGDAAKLLGEAFLDTLKQVKPSVEKDLLEKANAAILKAGKEREIRLGVSKLGEVTGGGRGGN